MARRAAQLLLAAALAVLACCAAAQPDVFREEGSEQLPAMYRVSVESENEAAVADQMIKAMMSVSKEVLTGEEDPLVFSAASLNTSDVEAAKVQAKVMAAAIATWQMGVIDAPSNKGLRPGKFLFYDRWHYYQIPKKPVGTLVMFHGCNHDASGNWPFDPDHCPECLGLPEEVAHVKLALKYGFAVLAVESRNRERNGRCFSASSDPMTSDMWQAPYVVQNFLYEKGLQNLPIYTLGISAGAAFATKMPKAFYDVNFGGVIKLGGIISEVNAPATWQSWGLLHRNGTLRYPDFPPVVFIMMERDEGPGSTNDLIRQRIADLRNYSIPADYLEVKSRPVGPTFFSDRSPVITVKQSDAIVKALMKLGFLDKNGWLRDDPRMGQANRKSPLYKWNIKLVKKLPWLHFNIKKLSENPALSVLSDRSSIFEELNVAYAMHEGIADKLVPCLFWLRSRGRLDIRWLDRKFSVSKLSQLTARRVYPAPFPPMPPPRPPSPSPRPPPRPRPPSPSPRLPPRRNPPPVNATKAVLPPSTPPPPVVKTMLQRTPPQPTTRRPPTSTV